VTMDTPGLTQFI